ncbi:MAG TPA: EF-P beta-lysylation protein EpmB [Pseudomonadales bacterium]
MADPALLNVKLLNAKLNIKQISETAIISSLDELLQFVQLTPETKAFAKLKLLNTPGTFPLRVPVAYAKRIKKGDPNDPLLKQILPVNEESQRHDDFLSDPVDDLNHQPVPGLIHKYSSRALLITTGACSIHCRYCFRREFPYADFSLLNQNLDAVISYLHQHKNIQEIILSGGDPLTLSNRRLENLLEKLAEVAHLKHLRIHSRQPIVIPDRIDQELIDLLAQNRLKTCVVIHCNHGNEIDQAVLESLLRLHRAGIVLLNQSVLLKGVNNNLQTLSDLSLRLYEASVLPYYINVLDRVQGSVHFLVDDEAAKALIKGMRDKLPGYLVPRLVKDIPGKDAKTILA